MFFVAAKESCLMIKLRGNSEMHIRLTQFLDSYIFFGLNEIARFILPRRI